MAVTVRYVSDIEIILGTYEEFLLGYKICKTEDKKYSLNNSFANHSHQASIRCCASSGQYLASGGADETIHLYNMDTRKEYGSLMQQNGTITCLAFHGRTHMFSASEDGSLCVWRVGSWQCEKILKGHRGPITSISIHPSGKLALSVGRDRTLRTWNLVKGRSAYVTNLAPLKNVRCGVDVGAEEVRWSLDGMYYAVMYRNKIDVYDVNIAGIVYSTDFMENRIGCICFLKDDIIAIGGEGGIIEFHDVQLKKKILRWLAYSEEERVRCIACIHIKGDQNNILMLTASSAGIIKLWQIKQSKMYENPECVGEVNAACRVTSLALCTPSTGMERKRRKSNAKAEVVKVEDEESVDINSDAKEKETSARDNGFVVMSDDDSDLGTEIKSASNIEEEKPIKLKKKKTEITALKDIDCKLIKTKSVKSNHMKEQKLKKKKKNKT